MNNRIDNDLEIELYDVFNVMQVTRGTVLEADVAADLVEMLPGQTSQIHRHNHAETVLYFLDGDAVVVVGDHEHPVEAGSRLRISKGEFHGVKTQRSSCRFLSIQTPPILNKTTGFRDLEEKSD